MNKLNGNVAQQAVHIAFSTVLLLVLSLNSHAKPGIDLFGEKPRPPSSSLDTDYLEEEEEPEFVRVDQAYQVFLDENENALTLDWNILEGYYLYQHRFNIVAQNAETKETLNFSSTPGEKKYDEYFAKELEIHYHNALLTAQLPTINKPYELVITSQGCADAGLCYPPRKQYFKINTQGRFQEQGFASFNPALKVDTAKVSEVKDTNTSTKEDPFLIAVLLGAVLGGLILNLMPCVFPVLSLKALSFASSNQSKEKQHLHGWAYTLGVVGSFWVAAVFILIARNAGESLGWGFQLQQPAFVAVMAYLFLIMGLSLSGLVHFGTSLMGVGNELTTNQGLKASFFTGVLAALVASPCTAPFMATALGFALTQPAFISLSIFTALGFGMALPFLLLSYSPALARFLPQPGAWMDTLKQLLAFPLYLTCVWLIWVLGRQTSIDSAAMLMLGGTALAFAAWLTTQAPHSKIGKFLKYGLMIFSLISAAWVIPTSSTQEKDEHWQTYSPETLEALRAESVPVFVNLTADWCITCKVNERVAFSSDKFIETAKQLKVTLLKGDWTNSNPQITELLTQYGRNGVPLYLMYPADPSKDAEILPQLLTASHVIKAMERGVK